MKRLNGKTMILWILTAILCVTSCAPAFASVGDRVLIRNSNSEGDTSIWIEGVHRMGDGFCVITNEKQDTVVLRYANAQSEPERFVMERPDYSTFYEDEEYDHDHEHEHEAEGEAAPEKSPADAEAGDDEDEDEEESFGLVISKKDEEEEEVKPAAEAEAGPPSYVNNWFTWNGELYGLQTKDKYENDEYTIEGLYAWHAKLEDGKVTLEESSIPVLDSQYVIENDGQNQNFFGLNNVFTTGDYLLGTSYGSMGAQKLVLFNLTDGSSSAKDIDYGVEFGPGPDGSILYVHADYGVDGTNYTINRLDPKTLDETKMAELKGLKDYQISACYDAETNSLYYVSGGEIWRMPDMDPEKAENVNEFSESSSASAMILPDGFIVFWGYNYVMVKNTDPAQRSGITLRVRDTNGSSAIPEAIHEMSEVRGDVSVILQQEYGLASDVLQAMMNKDGQTDIYVLRMDDLEFKALRNRDYLTDLSGMEQITKDVDRMYPYIQNAVKKDGKIIAIPVVISGTTICVNVDAWKKLGGTEEELPKTMGQFLDWLETLPKRVEGSDIQILEGYYMDQANFRSSLVDYLMGLYEMRMEEKSEDYTFNTPLLKDLLNRIFNIDYEALGIPEKYDENDTSSYEWHESLMNFGYFYGLGNNENTPLALALEEGDEPIIPVQMSAAFINPYSEHPEEAKEFFGLILKHLDVGMQYAVFTDKTEPVESSYADENRKYHEETMEHLQKHLEKAEGEEKAEIEESIRQEEQNWEEQQRWLWMISPDTIEWYQKFQGTFRIMDSLFLREIIGDGKDKSNLAIVYSLYGYETEDGQKFTPEEALEMLDKKLQMKHKEGN